MSVSLRPRVCDLIFRLYGRALHPELFDIVAVRKIRRENYTATLRITRTGHVITWEDADTILTEVVTDDDELLPRSRRLLDYRLRGEHSGSFEGAHGVVYQTSFQVEILSPEIFLHVHDELLADGGKRGLLCNFQPNHRLAIAPLGCIEVEAKPQCLLVSTFHTFPGENTVVKSQSLIEKKRSAVKF